MAALHLFIGQIFAFFTGKRPLNLQAKTTHHTFI